ncbi:helix-turn-helix transcriptional regulator [Cumulibacter manganitolerans]|uniref:helix-turn-helix transcriptional regulator n=1 Tax=Cumulibacter manganitolerans TaxID=1884992 RepID=UPI001885CDF4|nr:helix-turn-helix domain-containing protein [Cumulibacter manganitolerans]
MAQPTRDGEDAGGAGDRRARILRLLQEQSRALDITQIAALAGIHRNTVRFHLENLVAAGTVERSTGRPTARGGRPPQLFRTAPGWDRTGPRNYLGLAAALLEQLRTRPDAAAAAEEAGLAWGERLGADAPVPADADAARSTLTSGLRQLGFAPEQVDERRIDLRHCPFVELAADPDRLVCRLHRGLLQAAVAGWPDAIRGVDLEPEVEPGRCVVRLTPAQ